MSVESRWLTVPQYKSKSAKYPHLIFCDYTPPPPEENLRCSAPALFGNRSSRRCLSCKRIEIFYSRYDFKLHIYFPSNDQIFKEVTIGYKPRKISPEVYAELKRLDVKVCSHSEKSSEMVCGAPIMDDRNYCQNCSEKYFTSQSK
jgi:hypothetical protein